MSAAVRGHRPDRAARAARSRRPPPHARRGTAAARVRGLADRPAEPGAVRAADRRDARRAASPRWSPSSTSTTSSGQRHARPRRRRPAARDRGERLRNALRAGDTVARLGGDEFAILARGARRAATLLVERLFEVLAAPGHARGQAPAPARQRRHRHHRRRRRPAAQRRPRDVRRQGRRQQPLAVFTDDMHAHALERLDAASSSSARSRTTSSSCTTSRSSTSTRPRRRLRGAGALAAPDARPARPGRVHPAGRGDRPDRADRPLGAARGLPPGRDVGGRAVPERQRLGLPVRAARLRGRGRARAARRGLVRRRGSCSRSPRPR